MATIIADNPNNSRDLADVLGLESGPSEKPASKRPKTTLKNINDLGSIVGLGPGNETVVSKSTPSSLETVDPRVQSAPMMKRNHHGKDPKMWLLEPAKYPQVLEIFRVVKNSLVRLKKTDNLKVFLITGAEKKVGISTVTYNLGLVLAGDLSDHRVLLVDTNLANPSLHTAFERPLRPGLMDCLDQRLPWQKVVKRSHLPNLDLISIGQFNGRISSPFDLMEFSMFLEEVRRHYHYILLDSEAPFRSSETRIVSLKVDGVLIVVEANKTRWEVVNELKRQLENDGANLVGSFLNKRRFFIPNWVYRFI